MDQDKSNCGEARKEKRRRRTAQQYASKMTTQRWIDGDGERASTEAIEIENKTNL